MIERLELFHNGTIQNLTAAYIQENIHERNLKMTKTILGMNGEAKNYRWGL